MALNLARARRIMIDNLPDEIEEAVQRIVDLAQPEAIYLFGSRARGDHSEDSDWDLFVVMPDGLKTGEITTSKIWGSLNGLGMAFDIIACRRSVFEEMKHAINSVSHDVAKEGVLLYVRQ